MHNTPHSKTMKYKTHMDEIVYQRHEQWGGSNAIVSPMTKYYLEKYCIKQNQQASVKLLGAGKMNLEAGKGTDGSPRRHRHHRCRHDRSNRQGGGGPLAAVCWL